jgi:hypothetical protein
MFYDGSGVEKSRLGASGTYGGDNRQADATGPTGGV